MTEAEWLAATDPTPMLEYVLGTASDRKLRLFAVACCRRLWHLVIDPRSRQAVEVAERFTDCLATDEERQLAYSVAGEAVCDPTPGLSPYTMPSTDSERAGMAVECARSVVGYATRVTAAAVIPFGSMLRRLAEAAAYAAFDVSDPAFTASDMAEDGARIGQAVLLRDIFGNPFRPIEADPKWLTSAVVGLARAIYDGRAFDLMPILADALEEAGCDNPDVLNHWRQPSEHVRGCWVVDLLLGKE